MTTPDDPAARRWAALWKAKARAERGKADTWLDEALRAIGRGARYEARIAELETTIRKARQRLYDAHGRGPETVAQAIRAVGDILREQPAALPSPLCPACGQPAPPDALRVLDGARSGLACPACAEALRKTGWAVVRRGRGGDGT